MGILSQDGRASIGACGSCQQLLHIPVHGELDAPHALALEAEVALLQAVVEEVAGQGHVVGAVVGHEVEAPLLEPLEALEAVGRLLAAKGVVDKVGQREPKAQPPVDVLKDVEGGQLR